MDPSWSFAKTATAKEHSSPHYLIFFNDCSKGFLQLSRRDSLKKVFFTAALLFSIIGSAFAQNRVKNRRPLPYRFALEYKEHK